MRLNEVVPGIEWIGNNINKLIVDNSLVNYSEAKDKKIEFFIKEPNFSEVENGYMAQICIGFVLDINGNEEQKCHIEIEIEGAYLSTGDISKEDFQKIVMVNGAAALVGIARGKIESISANIFNSGKIVIPFINVIDYYKESA